MLCQSHLTLILSAVRFHRPQKIYQNIFERERERELGFVLMYTYVYPLSDLHALST